MTLSLSALRAAAEKATPGPWVSPDPHDNCVTTVYGKYITDDPDAWPNPENTRFIALANPETILALCRVVEAARQVLSDCSQEDRASSNNEDELEEALREIES